MKRRDPGNEVVGGCQFFKSIPKEFDNYRYGYAVDSNVDIVTASHRICIVT